MKAFKVVGWHAFPKYCPHIMLIWCKVCCPYREKVPTDIYDTNDKAAAQWLVFQSKFWWPYRLNFHTKLKLNWLSKLRQVRESVFILKGLLYLYTEYLYLCISVTLLSQYLCTANHLLKTFQCRSTTVKINPWHGKHKALFHSKNRLFIQFRLKNLWIQKWLFNLPTKCDSFLRRTIFNRLLYVSLQFILPPITRILQSWKNWKARAEN